MPSNSTRKKLAFGFVGDKTLRIAVLSFLVFVVVLLLFAAWRNWTRPTQRGDYEGRIVDRWADNGGQAENYQPRLALLIESNDGRRFTVRVDLNVYESARVGMRIRSRSGQVVLTEQNSSPSK
jgi:hypothetical protein